MLKKIRKLFTTSLASVLVLSLMFSMAAAFVTVDADIVTFGIQGQSRSAIIDNANNTVLAIMPIGTDLSTLAPIITVSEGATIHPLSRTERDFTDDALTYTVTALDGITTKTYSVTVLAVGGAPETNKDITSFTIAGQLGSTIINNVQNTILLYMPFGTDLTSLTPSITLESTSSTISPGSGVARSFANPAIYVVESPDYTFKDYTVTVTTVLPFASKDIIGFSIEGYSRMSSIGENTVLLTLPYGTDLTNLLPLITISGTSIDPPSNAPQNFTNPRLYTVTAQDGSTKTYTVTVNTDDPPASSAKNITSFSIGEQVPDSTVINNTLNTITLTMPAGINLTGLAPLITVSAGATVSPASGQVRDFNTPVIYTVTAQDSTTRQYTVTVTSAASSTKDITSFSIAGQMGSAIIGANTITLTMPFGTNLSNLSPSITVSAGATVNPASGVAQNFSNPRVYTVTAQDNTTKQYTVTVTAASASSAKDITGFSIPGQISNSTVISGNTITVAMPAGTTLTNLVPTITHTGASISPTSGSVQNFTSPRTYTVTASDGTVKQYTVTVTSAVSNANDIIAFSIIGQSGSAIIGPTTVSLSMPFGTNLTNLSPTIAIPANASISPASGASQDFSNSVTYTVTAQNGTTKQYTVSVTAAQASAGKDITGFSIPGQTGITVINADTISVTVPDSANLANLTPNISVSAGSSVNPAPGVAQNFTNPVTYTVTAQDGSMKQYIVTVVTASNNAKDITQFSIPGQSGNAVIGTNTISLSMPFGTNLTNLVPDVIVSPNASVTPASGVARNFSTPQTYTVRAADGTTKQYSVNISIAQRSNDKNITAFTIAGQVGDTAIGTSTVTVTMPFGTDVTWLRPNIEVSTNASINPRSGEARNFTNLSTYTVTAENGTTKAYTVQINFSHGAVRDEKDILHFHIPGQIGSSFIGPNTITVAMPYNANITWLRPDIIASQGAWVEPGSGVARNFTSPVIYTVRAQNGSVKTYSVNIVRESSTVYEGRDITSFSIPGQIGVSNIGTNAITVTMPYGTDVTSLRPNITVSLGARTSPASGVAVNFTNPVTYTVTAESGVARTYTVTVNYGNSSQGSRDITSFSIPGQIGNTVIGTDTISLTMPAGTNLTSLRPNITVSQGASINPVSGTARNFTNSAAYTVTASDGSVKQYTVTVNIDREQPFSTTISIPLVDGNSPSTGVLNPENAMRGAIVHLPTITARAGYAFSSWTVRSGGVAVVNSSSASGAYFTMGSQNVAIDAIFTVQPMTFSNQVLPDGITGIAYRASAVPPSNGSGRYTYSAELPAGLRMSRDGVITGTPSTSVSAHTFTVTANDTVNGMSSQAAYTITIIESSSGVTATLQFSDTPVDSWYYDAILYAYNNGYMDGDSTEFNPNMLLTRSMIVTALYRHAGSPDTSGLPNPFSDVGHTNYTEAVLWAAENNIVTGHDNRYFPEDNITRQDLAAIFYRYAQFIGRGAYDESAGLDYFSDADSISDYATDAAAFCYDKGIIIGRPGNLFAPRENATRAEFATMLMRFLTV